MAAAESSVPLAAAAAPSYSGPKVRVLNVRFALCSIGLFAALAVAAFFLHRWQVGRSAGALLQRASALEGEQRWLEAAEYVERYLRLAPSAADQRVRLARIYEKGISTPAHRDRAIELYYRALGAGVPEEQTALQKELGALLLTAERDSDARSVAEQLLTQAPNDAAGLRIRGLALWGQWKAGILARESDNLGTTPTEAAAARSAGYQGTNKVITALEDGLAANEGDLDLSVALAAAYRDRELKAYAHDQRALPSTEAQELTEQQRIAQADACIEQLVKHQADNAQAWLASYSYRQTWKMRGAEADLQDALRLAPEYPQVLLTAANASRLEGERQRQAGGDSDDAARHFEQARSHYSKLIELGLDRSHPLASLGLGDVYVALHRPQEAVRVWQAALEHFKNDPVAVEFHSRLVSVWLDQNDLKQAEQALKAVDLTIAKFPPGVARDAVLAIEMEQDFHRGVWHFKRNEPALAIPALQRVTLRQEQLGGKSDHATRALLLLGSAFATQGQWQESAEAYDQAAVQEPGLAMAPLAASTSWLAANAVDAALDRADRAVRLESSCRTWYTYATASLRQQMLLPPNERVWAQLEQATTSALEAVADGTLTEAWRVYLLRADYLLVRDDQTKSTALPRQEALAVLQEAEKKFPQTAGLWQTLPLVYERMGARDEADQACDRLSQLVGTTHEGQMVRARLLAQRGDFSGAEQRLQAAGKEGLPPDVIQSELIALKLMQRDFAAAQVLLKSAIKQSPNDIRLLRHLADIELEARNYQQVESCERALLACGNAGEALALFFGIRRQLAQMAKPEARLLATIAEEHARLLSLRPNWAEAVALGGTIEQARGNLEQAIAAYQRAIALGDQRIHTYERLISLLEGANRSIDAARYLAQQSTLVPHSQSLTVYESVLELRRNQVAEAVAIARKGVEKRPQDPAAHIWLGRLLAQSGRPLEAREALRRAVELGPTNVQAWQALFGHYVRQGERDEAQQVLAQLADEAQLPENDRTFILAQSYELLGDQQESRKYYAQAIAANPNNAAVLLRAANSYRHSDLDKALALAKQAFELDATAPARRAYAVFLAERGNPADWAEIDRLFDGAADSAAMADDNRFRALLLVRRGGMQNVRQAIEIMEELVDKAETKSGADRLQLAQLYERMAQLTDDDEAAETIGKAAAHFQTLCDRNAPQPQHVIAFIEFSLRHRRDDDAQRGLTRLAQAVETAGRPPAQLAELVRLHLAQGNTPQAEQYLKSLEAAAPNALPCITLRAHLMERQGNSAGIETYVEAAAAQVLKMAAQPQEQVSVYHGIGNLYASLKNARRSEEWFRKLYQAAPNQFSPLVETLAHQNRLAEALQICREAGGDEGSVPTTMAAISAVVRGTPTEEDLAQLETLIASARRRHPENLPLLSAVAALRVKLGRSDDAIEIFSTIAEMNGRDAVALNNLATLLGEKPQRRDEALQLVDRAIKIAGPEPSLLDTRGTILYLQGRASEAMSSLEPAVRDPNADPRYRFHLALVYQALSRGGDARSELERALAKDLEKQLLTQQEQALLAELRTQLSL